MSTYLYLECLEHPGGLKAEYESGQHLYDLPRIRQDIADRALVAEQQKMGDLYLAHDRISRYCRHRERPCECNDAFFRWQSGLFLAAHPNCRLGIVDEDGKHYLPFGKSEEPVPFVSLPFASLLGDD